MKLSTSSEKMLCRGWYPMTSVDTSFVGRRAERQGYFKELTHLTSGNALPARLYIPPLAPTFVALALAT